MKSTISRHEKAGATWAVTFCEMSRMRFRCRRQRSNEVDMLDSREVGKVLVRLVHPAIQAALLDVELLHELPVLAPAGAFPYLAEGLLVDVADLEALIQKMRRAGEDVA